MRDLDFTFFSFVMCFHEGSLSPSFSLNVLYAPDLLFQRKAAPHLMIMNHRLKAEHIEIAAFIIEKRPPVASRALNDILVGKRAIASIAPGASPGVSD
jgi:hypothetical protein